MSNTIDRRTVIKNLSITAGTLGLAGVSASCVISVDDKEEKKPKTETELKGNINHTACRWCYQDIPLETFAEKSAEIGLKAIDLLTPEEWPMVAKYGLKSSLGTDVFADIQNGFNTSENHASLQQKYMRLIDKASDNDVKQVIVFSGNRNGMSDDQGLENCAIGLDPLVNYASKKGITVIMELLNSKVDHRDYQCDRTPWGVQLVEKIGSDHFRLLYDIYHMQIMEGDVIATIRKYHQYIAHYHTGGVPGRNEINDSQELNYPAIMKAIVATGFKGYVAQEFIPTYEDKLAALKEGVLICDI
ncbi:TIM barrel protein [Spongiivirga sp. MCCC 1A20706]|uniref:hydroxypyruvate isomerase family protein n=1 Tax=Spongiivirga sp. MCCC 1A20706 TaxID=3160963 RepID=UPI0039776572